MKKLPPLNQLKAFEAAGRLGSFKAAAADLCVSEAAISQHIRALEAYLGAPLFIRTYSGVILTAAGTEFSETLTQAFDLIKSASAKFLASELKGAVRISVAPSLGSRWLIPRLSAFSEKFPEIQVEPIMTPRLVKLGSDADMSIRHGTGNWKDAKATRLMGESLIPVASKSLTGSTIHSPHELLNYPLLTAVRRKSEWHHWFIAQGVSIATQQQFVVYDTVALALDAAIAGVGICLIDKTLVHEDLKEGRLNLVCDRPVPGINSYYVVVPKGSTPDPKVVALSQWLCDEANN